MPTKSNITNLDDPQSVRVVQLAFDLELPSGSGKAIQIITEIIRSDADDISSFAEKIGRAYEYRYRNRMGEIVEIKFAGIHSVEDLQIFESEKSIQISSFIFTEKTTISDLVFPESRKDLPNLDQ